ncbi:MAG: ATP-dependent RecD-like DNA helicase [Desulfovibrionaceae bacterium]|nr:ATP-dependent RecD-like DNA helicase [Desulfovibrionaceae bacterium]
MPDIPSIQGRFDAVDSLQELRGTLERVIFHNEENGYTVFRLACDGCADEEIVVVGCMPSPKSGVTLTVRGQWVDNRKFGRQFRMESWSEADPESAEDIRRYLASGLIDGIGQVLARRIVEHFGRDTLSVLDEHPERLEEVCGIGCKKAETIRASLGKQRQSRALVTFLERHDIGVSYAVRIAAQYGDQALEVVKKNPYRLAMDIRGIGFLTADALAQKIGFPVDHPLRVQAALLYRLVKGTEEGHVYLPLDRLCGEIEQDFGISSAAVHAAAEELIQEKRLVREDFGDHVGLYLSRWYLYESKISFYLYRLLTSPKTAFFENPEKTLAEMLKGLDITLAPEQILAVKTAMSAKVMVLTGGPGTGKTTVLKAILRVFFKNRAKTKVLLAAPTGRAAKRMSEACGREARTIHRLLEYNPNEDAFSRNEDNPLECDLLIVDEASMMDTMLAYHLLKAVPFGCTLILVGDVHQLPSVGPGNVLRDLISSGAVRVVQLEHIFRFAEANRIISSAHAINHGIIPDLSSKDGVLSDFYFIRSSDPEKTSEMIVTLVRDRIPLRFRLDPFNDVQVLTPMHKGPLGDIRLNTLLQEALNPRGAFLKRGEAVFRRLDKVMQTKNNYEKDVYNGDIGRITCIDGERKSLSVEYDEDRTVCYDWDELDEIVPAYAISIHKSQGSEYPAVIIPLMMSHYVMLQRNLIYTAVTRGRKLVIIIGETKALAMAVRNASMQKRCTRLAERLADAEEFWREE